MNKAFPCQGLLQELAVPYTTTSQRLNLHAGQSKPLTAEHAMTWSCSASLALRMPLCIAAVTVAAPTLPTCHAPSLQRAHADA